MNRIQLALDPLVKSPSVWANAPALLRKNHITIVSGMFGCEGEDYQTLETIRATGGVAPDSTWEQNREHVQKILRLPSELNLSLITFHAGFLPHRDAGRAYAKMHERLGFIADSFNAQKITLGFETGQETAQELSRFLLDLNRSNVKVNFDPANMLLYDKGDPVDAVRVLAPWICQVHLKDARRTRQPGTWGEEVPLGTGEVNWRTFFTALSQADFNGDFVVEREAGNKRVAEILAGTRLIEQFFSEVESKAPANRSQP
jgi:sugar phosphate isomerase/epimerase